MNSHRHLFLLAFMTGHERFTRLLNMSLTPRNSQTKQINQSPIKEVISLVRKKTCMT